ncbi:hypothetical protein DYB28_015435 [Aphanomyces astaci]|uniref:Uncharacterized protein n=1 Tax=Aphanomyces astaci TaxID=112090 RepID=A0A9X8EA01_APHAT|nr:hypothetical protein DYB28_015435 [Aphanomyces astaci]
MAMVSSTTPHPDKQPMRCPRGRLPFTASKSRSAPSRRTTNDTLEEAAEVEEDEGSTADGVEAGAVASLAGAAEGTAFEMAAEVAAADVATLEDEAADGATLEDAAEDVATLEDAAEDVATLEDAAAGVEGVGSEADGAVVEVEGSLVEVLGDLESMAGEADLGILLLSQHMAAVVALLTTHPLPDPTTRHRTLPIMNHTNHMEGTNRAATTSNIRLLLPATTPHRLIHHLSTLPTMTSTNTTTHHPLHRRTDNLQAGTEEEGTSRLVRRRTRPLLRTTSRLHMCTMPHSGVMSRLSRISHTAEAKSTHHPGSRTPPHRLRRHRLRDITTQDRRLKGTRSSHPPLDRMAIPRPSMAGIQATINQTTATTPRHLRNPPIIATA